MSFCHEGEMVLGGDRRLIHPCMIVLSIRLRSYKPLKCARFGVARSLSTQIKLVSDHL